MTISLNTSLGTTGNLVVDKTIGQAAIFAPQLAPSNLEDFPELPGGLTYRHAKNLIINVIRPMMLGTLNAEDTEDIVQDAIFSAYRTYDPLRGAAFSTHLYHRARGAFLDFIEAKSAKKRGGLNNIKTFSELDNEDSMLFIDTISDPNAEGIFDKIFFDESSNEVIERDFLDLKLPSAQLAAIISSHPQAQSLCAGQNPADVPAKGQLKILAHHFGGSGIINETLGEEFPGIGWRIRDAIHYSHRLCLRLSDFEQMVKFWDARKTKVFLSKDHPLPILSDIISGHSEAQELCGARNPANVPLWEQLSICLELFNKNELVENVLGGEFPNISKRLAKYARRKQDNHITSATYYLRWDEVQAAANIWKKQSKGQRIFLPLYRPIPILTAIISGHPQAKGLCGGRDPADVPLGEQLKILSDYWGGPRAIDRAIGKQFPGIGARVSSWVYYSARPKLKDLEEVAHFWDTEKRQILLSQEYPIKILADIISGHPQVTALCGERAPGDLPLEEQIGILSDHWAGRQLIDHALAKKFRGIHRRVHSWLFEGRQPRLQDLQKVAQVWHSYNGLSRLLMDQPAAILATLINSHQKAKALCKGKDPTYMPLRNQLRVCADAFGAGIIIEKVLGNGIGRRATNWIFLNDRRPKLDDFIAVVDFWEKVSKGECLVLSKPHPDIARSFGFGMETNTRLIAVLGRLAHKLEKQQVSILPQTNQDSIGQIIMNLVQTSEGCIKPAAEIKTMLKKRTVLEIH